MQKKTKVSFLGNASSFDENKLISDFTSTILEKILKTLKKVKQELLNTDSSPLLVRELDWVVLKLNSGADLYEVEEIDTFYHEMAAKDSNVSNLIEIINAHQNIKSKEFIKESKHVHLSKSATKRNERNNTVLNFKKNEEVRLKDKIKTMAHKMPINKPKGNRNDYASDSVNFIPFEEELALIEKSEENQEELKIESKQNQIRLHESFNSLQSKENLKLSFKSNYLFYDNLQSIHFDILTFAEKNGRKGIVSYVFKGILSDFDLKVSKAIDYFCREVEEGYTFNVPYHNEIHGCDVIQTLFSWVLEDSISQTLNLNHLDLLGLFTAAILHDIGHKGLNNNFHVMQSTDLAITYNDKSVLENFHGAFGSRILSNFRSNIFSDYRTSDNRYMRRRIVDCILATDMAGHNKHYSMMKNKIEYLDINFGDNADKLCPIESKTLFEDQQDMLNFLIHCADLSHNTKVPEISSKWTALLYEEFFLQGEKEKLLGLEISFLCDRDTTDIPRNQIGFLKGIVIPTFETLIHIFSNLNFTVDMIQENLERWDKLAREGEKEQ